MVHTGQFLSSYRNSPNFKCLSLTQSPYQLFIIHGEEQAPPEGELPSPSQTDTIESPGIYFLVLPTEASYSDKLRSKCVIFTWTK